MDYDIVEDLKKVKANVPLFEMCKVLQQKERLLKVLEASDEKLPTDNQPQGEEERKETSTSTPTKEQEEETMALWNSVSLFDVEEEKNQGYKMSWKPT